MGDTDDVEVKDKIEKALYQLLAANGVIDRNTLLDAVEFIKPDFSQGEQSLEQILRNINQQESKFSFEVRSVKIKENANTATRTEYFALVNTEEDNVSRDHGSPFVATELSLFAKIALRMLADNYLSTDDIIAHTGLTRNKVEHLLKRLQQCGWLDRNERNYWAIGIRSFIELDPYFRQIVREQQGQQQGQETAGGGGGDGAEVEASLLAKLPQVIHF